MDCFTGNESLLRQVRTSCRSVASQSVLVRINHDRLRTYALQLPLDETVLPLPDPSCHFLGHGEQTVAFFLTLNTVNFGSGYFPYLRKRNGMSGYFTVASFLNDYFKEHGPFSAEQLTETTADTCIEIFHQDPACQPAVELMRLFAEALGTLGEYLVSHFDGSFTAMVNSAGFSAEQLVRTLIRMPFFNDSATYLGENVKFFKRAQITAADLYLSFNGQGSGRFDDIDNLTIFADNLVPHVLRLDGILDYDDGLLSRIEKEEEIPSGSPEEIEIRACSVHAVELMVEELKRSGKDVNSMKLDQFLWNRGQLPQYKKHPRHRTRTVYY
jgi:hypothetical protein